ncbi:MAG: hypothetical protein B6244_11580 [Candidatus Cloacimonetes bacterium 4572_55]|nr:MAG: hypothetical protein B6244_11580 [Candidatus Cloacimonetes bacterium 4572_55]
MEPSQMKASVIIPCYNGPEFIRSCLDCFRIQTHLDFEVVVVDDGSDHPLDIDPDTYPFSLRILSHPKNRGRAAARNTGVRAARNDLIIFLDSDMIVSSDFIAAHVAAHELGECGAIVGDIRFTDQWSGQPLAKYFDTRGAAKLKSGKEIPYRYFVTGNASTRKSLLISIGLFDEGFPKYGGEDLELACRLHEQGIRFAHCPAARSLHDDLPSIARHRRRMEEYGRYCLPYLVENHHYAADFLKLEWAGHGEQRRLSARIKQLAGTLFFRRPIITFLIFLVNFFPLTHGYLPRKFSFFLFDVITGGSYLIGYRRSLIEK